MATTTRCGTCNADLQQVSNSVTHPQMEDGSIVCGEFARRTFGYVVDIDEPVRVTDAQRVLAARRELETIQAVIAHHLRQHDTPPEVESEAGWMDVTDLLRPLETALT